MTDRELLEFAAYAAGIDHISLHADGEWYAHDGECAFRYRWNPLLDDGDALRLAVKLELQVGYSEFTGEGVAHWDRGSRQVREYGPTDQCQSLRVAIVRAAAEIGKAMP